MGGPRGAAFFDRDGVINEDRGYVHRAAEFVLLPGAADAIRACNRAGLFVFVVTNQSGVARGFYDVAAVEELHRHMIRSLGALDARIDDIRFCPHLPEGQVAGFAQPCECRKPAPGMLHDLIQHWPVDTTRSFMIGDKPTDIEAAARAGVAGYLLRDRDVVALVDHALAERGAILPPDPGFSRENVPRDRT